MLEDGSPGVVIKHDQTYDDLVFHPGLGMPEDEMTGEMVFTVLWYMAQFNASNSYMATFTDILREAQGDADDE